MRPRPQPRAAHFSSLRRMLQSSAPAGGEALRRILAGASGPEADLREPEPVPPEPGVLSMPEGGYSIRVRKDGLEFEVSGDKSFVLAESQRLFETLFQSGGAPSAARGASSDQALRESLLDFLANISASGHPETILALSYFLGERGHSPIGVGDVEACYELLGIPSSSNFNADFNSLVRRKLLLEAPRGQNGRKAWLLTEQGLAFIHEKIRPS